MDELVKDFLVESNENLDRLDKELVELESDPFSKDLLSSVFRTIHTVKGSCGFLGFAKLEKVAHAGENLLSKLREGKLVLTSEVTSGLLAMVDAIRTMLDAIQATEQDGDSEYRELIEVLTRLQQAASDPPSKQASPAVAENATASSSVSRVEARQPAIALSATPEIPQSLDASTLAKSDPEKTPAADIHTDARSGNAPAETVRVDVTLLDRMMNLVGELVLARNQITQFAGRQTDAVFLATSQQLNLLTSELQEEVTKTRMQPISNIFDKFPRVVRDLAMACGKQVQVDMDGKETELDKSLLEAIKDPLTHIVRNSIDHGIERPEQRAARGKRPEGRLALRAWHEGGQVINEISDDGAGIDSDRIKKKALERGMITAQIAARMSEREALNLIFLPGLSTAEKVSNLSGRGVGMDVVKTNIEKVNGSVDIQSSVGRGTTIKIKIPLTLAIVPVLIVRSAGRKFAIPQVSLIELVRLDSEVAGTAIELVHGVPVYRLRGRLLPLAYLSRELALAPLQNGSASGAATNIVVLQADERHFGLVVDAINDTEEIVVKPLSKQLRGIESYAGATIMGDGKVALILDVLGVAKRAGVISEVRDRALAEEDTEIEKKNDDQQSFILFAGPDDARMALPLGLLSRLEEFPSSQIEKSGADWVAQYRGKILPLIRLGLVLEERRRPRHADAVPPAGSDPVQVLFEQQRTIVRHRRRENSGYRRGPGRCQIARHARGHRVCRAHWRPGHRTARYSRYFAGASCPALGSDGSRGGHALAMSETLQFCTFYLDKVLFGVELQGVQEVMQQMELTDVPLAPGVVGGLMNLRGQIVTAIDLRRRLELPERPPGMDAMNVVVRTRDGAVSLLVDQIGDVVEVDADSFEPPPEMLQGKIRSVILGVHKLEKQLMHLLDIEKACEIGEPEVMATSR